MCLILSNWSTTASLWLTTSTLSGDELKQLCVSTPRAVKGAFSNPSLGYPVDGHAAKIAPDAVVKISSHTSSHERLSAEPVCRHAAIPIPTHGQIIHVFPESYPAQQYISGRVLLEA